jgi:hypothetical protein
MKTLPLLALSLVAALAARPASADHITGASVPICGQNDGRPAVGAVVALSGSATSAAPECPPLPVACDATVRAGDHLVTGPGASVALRAQGRYVQLGPDSELVASRTGEGAPDLTLLRGRMRVVAEEDIQVGPPIRIATPDLETLSPGDDTEAVAEVDPAHSSLCSWAGPIQVRPRAGGAALDATAGQCVGGGHGAVPAASSVGTLAVSLLDAARCGVADLGDLTPFEVAGGPPAPGFPVAPFNLPPRPYCQSGTCGGTHGSPPPSHIPVVESPPGNAPPP